MSCNMYDFLPTVCRLRSSSMGSSSRLFSPIDSSSCIGSCDHFAAVTTSSSDLSGWGQWQWNAVASQLNWLKGIGTRKEENKNNDIKWRKTDGNWKRGEVCAGFNFGMERYMFVSSIQIYELKQVTWGLLQNGCGPVAGPRLACKCVVAILQTGIYVTPLWADLEKSGTNCATSWH